jgi:hypothetical protein
MIVDLPVLRLVATIWQDCDMDVTLGSQLKAKLLMQDAVGLESLRMMESMAFALLTHNINKT